MQSAGTHGRRPAWALNIHFQENSMNKDQAKGRVEQVKGKVKAVAGELVGNKDLEQEGKVQELVGKVQAGYGDLKQELKKSS
jgi:uncharacterized protein YjbJ (UPF0337 family)